MPLPPDSPFTPPLPPPPSAPPTGLPALFQGVRAKHAVLFAALGIAGYVLVYLSQGDLGAAGRAALPALGLLATYWHQANTPVTPQ